MEEVGWLKNKQVWYGLTSVRLVRPYIYKNLSTYIFYSPIFIFHHEKPNTRLIPLNTCNLCAYLYAMSCMHVHNPSIARHLSISNATSFLYLINSSFTYSWHLRAHLAVLINLARHSTPWTLTLTTSTIPRKDEFHKIHMNSNCGVTIILTKQ